jgi:hypothetical protein
MGEAAITTTTTRLSRAKECRHKEEISDLVLIQLLLYTTKPDCILPPYQNIKQNKKSERPSLPPLSSSSSFDITILGEFRSFQKLLSVL